MQITRKDFFIGSLAATAALVIGSMWLSASRAVFYRELKDARRGNMV